MNKPLLLCLIPVFFATFSAFGDDLQQVYELARASDPTLRGADANRLAVRESKPQAVGAMLPQLTGGSSYAWDNPYNVRSGPQPPFSVISTNTNTRTQTYSWNAQLRQQVFHWDSWVKLQQADKQAVQADVDYHVAELDLYLRVSTAYFNVLAAQDTLGAAEAAKEAIGRQLEQAQKRFEVGLIAITDVQEAQSGYDNAVATVISAKRSLANSNEALRAITGQYPGPLAEPGSELPLVSPAPADENKWVGTALQQNFALQSAQLGAEIARDNIGVQRAGHLPTIDLVGTYTNTYSNGGSTFTLGGSGFTNVCNPDCSGANSSRNLDPNLALQLSVPIFSGGATQSKVRQAVYQHRASKEKLETTARETERQTRDSYQGVISDISRVQALDQAVKSAQVALQATEAGFEVGTRTTVDVLTGRQNLFNAQTNFAQSRYTYIIDVLRLKQAAGTLDDKDVAEVNGWLK